MVLRNRRIIRYIVVFIAYVLNLADLIHTNTYRFAQAQYKYTNIHKGIGNPLLWFKVVLLNLWVATALRMNDPFTGVT